MCKFCKNQSHIAAELSKEFLEGLPPIFKKAMQDLHAGIITPADLSGELLTAIAQELWRGVEIGFNGAENLAESILYQQLENNIYVFSGFKTYHQLKEASLLLKGENGAIKPFSTFYKDVMSIDNTYNHNYLAAEYNNAIASSQMAANWQEFAQNGADFPLLQYKTAEDDRVRPSHQVLDLIVKRYDDPFWQTYYPPNGWNCRCDVIQLTDTDESLITTEFDSPTIPAMFRNNTGQSGIVFPDTHPYFDVMDNETKLKVTASALKHLPKK
jgi:SPP1 gp7 family putative phage head morphogenesis protein